MFLPLLVMLVLFSSSTCKQNQTTSNQAASEPVDILNKTWYLESVTLAGKSEHIFPATLVVGEQKITGKGGCNNFFGKYELIGDKITLSKIGATRMYCQDASKFETKYLRALESVTSYTQKENRLVLTWDGGKLVFSSSPKETAADETKGTIHDIKWQLKSITMRGVARDVHRTKTGITLLVERDKVSGSGGCNNYFGQLRMEGNRFIVSDIGATEMYCDDSSKQEMTYLRLLEKVTTFRLAGDQLILSFPDGTLTFGQK